jgi:hypothetical protein
LDEVSKPELGFPHDFLAAKFQLSSLVLVLGFIMLGAFLISQIYLSITNLIVILLFSPNQHTTRLIVDVHKGV